MTFTCNCVPTTRWFDNLSKSSNISNPLFPNEVGRAYSGTPPADWTDRLFDDSLWPEPVLVIAGQSNAQNIAPTPYTPIHTSAVDNLSIYDGQMYAAADPLLGTMFAPPRYNCGCFATRLGDNLVSTGKFDRVILFPFAVGGTSVMQWIGNGPAASRVPASGYRLRNAGLSATAILWAQGESDTTLGTTTPVYVQQMLTLIGNFRAAGMVAPFLVAKQSWIGGITSSAVVAAQAQVVDSAAGIFPGPDADSLNATYRQADNTHFNDAGMIAYANLWQAALVAVGPPFA